MPGRDQGGHRNGALYRGIVCIGPEYRYYFKDETSDVYQVMTLTNRDFWLKYNSDKPTIIAIKRVRLEY